MRGLGVFVDDAKITVDGSQTAHTGFETDGDISPFTVGGPPEGSPGNANNWTQTTSVGFEDGPGVAHRPLGVLGLRPRGRDRRRPRAATLLQHALSQPGGVASTWHATPGTVPGVASPLGAKLKVGSPTCYFRRHGHRHLRERRPQARLRRQAQALHLHRRARAAAGVDPRVRDAGVRPPRRRVGGDDLPRRGLPEDGRAGLPRPRQAGRVRRRGRRLLRLARARRGDGATRSRGGLAMGIAVHTDMAMPPILAFGTEEQKQEWVVPAIKGEKILCLGITEPDAGSDVAGHQDARGARRRRVRHQRLQDVHHQRPPRRRDRARDEDRPRRRLRRLHALPRADGRARA